MVALKSQRTLFIGGDHNPVDMKSFSEKKGTWSEGGRAQKKWAQKSQTGEGDHARDEASGKKRSLFGKEERGKTSPKKKRRKKEVCVISRGRRQPSDEEQGEKAFLRKQRKKALERTPDLKEKAAETGKTQPKSTAKRSHTPGEKRVSQMKKPAVRGMNMCASARERCVTSSSPDDTREISGGQRISKKTESGKGARSGLKRGRTNQRWICDKGMRPSRAQKTVPAAEGWKEKGRPPKKG